MHEEMIPIVMFIMVGLAVIAYFYIGYLKRQLESKEIISAIEHGADVPFPEPKKKNYLLPGVIWTLLGLLTAVGLAISIPNDPHVPQGVWVWGLTPAAIGVGYLVAYYVDLKKPQD